MTNLTLETIIKICHEQNKELKKLEVGIITATKKIDGEFASRMSNLFDLLDASIALPDDFVQALSDYKISVSDTLVSGTIYA